MRLLKKGLMSSLALITKVLNVLDGLLDKKVDLFIIGGAAAVLGYGSTRTTRDIDTWMTVPTTSILL